MRVHILPEAWDGLDQVVAFAEKLHGTAVASDVFTSILSRIAQLEFQPHAAPIIQLKGVAPFHQLTVEHLTIALYRIEGDVIEIHKIYDARTDWKA